MPHFLARAVGHKALGHAKRRGWIDVRFGLDLLRDRRIPLLAKVGALGLGFILTLAMEALEVPLEALLAAIVPFLGLGVDMLIDGVEMVVMPFVFAAIILTHLAPKRVVDVIRNERQTPI